MLSRLSILALLAAGLRPLASQQDCASLTRLNLPHTTIISAAIASEGRVPPPAASTNAAPLIAAAHCAVQAVTRPTEDSEIRFELWLPTSEWNGKFLQLGNGGWAGQINLAAMADPL